jgi:hypothetical protein
MPIEQVHTFARPSKADAADLVRRATVAWLQQAGGGELPSPASGFKMHKTLGYVVLHGASGVLAVYRVRPDNGALRRMKRWPAAVASRAAD